jgi:hypothetical protein
MFRSYRLVIAALLLVLVLAACGGSQPAATSESSPSDQSAQPATAEPTEAPAATESPAATETPAESALKIQDVVFTHALGEDMTPTDVAESYTPEQDIFVSVKLDGNPKEGVVSATFYYGDQNIADAQVDLAQARDGQGIIFVIGGDTFVGFTLSHDNLLPVSANYGVALALDGEPAGKYDFAVTQPEGSIPSKLLSATLAQDVNADTYEPYNPTDTFPADRQVFLAGRADLGQYGNLAARWFINGELDGNGTRIVTTSEDSPDVPFYFSYLPEGNWPEGQHKVILYINDDPVGEYEFTVVSSEQ